MKKVATPLWKYKKTKKNARKMRKEKENSSLSFNL
jgi:hypothetical protein